MIQIIAMSPASGWAFVKDDSLMGETVRVVRPPYRDASVQFTTLVAARTAIEKHGFVAGPDAAFASWPEIVRYLRANQAEFRRGLPEWDHRTDAPKILASAPPQVIVRYLDKIENEWLPAERIDQAARFLRICWFCRRSARMMRCSNERCPCKLARPRLSHLLRRLCPRFAASFRDWPLALPNTLEEQVSIDPWQHEDVTFYSYKGGVGRSLALANFAKYAVNRGFKVVLLDMDLEAPGLHTNSLYVRGSMSR